MPRVKIKDGDRFSRLLVIGRIENSSWGKAVFECLCDCGTSINVIAGNLSGKITHSCGCLQRERTGNANRKHGYCGTKTYRAWKNAKSRCYNKNNKAYKNYGGRGIVMCDSWLNNFDTFLQDMGECPNKHSLDRADNNGNYEAKNCRWATPKQQGRNQRSNIIVDKTSKKCLKELSEELGINYSTMHCRYREGRSITTGERE